MTTTRLNSLEEYGPSFQTKVISSLLTHKKFLLSIHDVLTDEYFSTQASKWIVGQILRYYSEYHCPPTMEVLKVEMKKITNDVLQIAIKEQLKQSYSASEDDLEYIENEFSGFCKNQQLKRALLDSVDLLKGGEYDSIRFLIDSALKAGQDKNIGHEYDKDTESRYREDNRVIIPTPWDKINELIQGGLGNGDFGLVFGNPGGGKSWALVALGGCAVQLGYNVVHYTLELGEDYVGKRYDAFFTGIPVDKLKNFKSKVQETITELPGKLIIKEYTPGKASISTLESHIKKCEDLGFKTDLIIIDYVDLLSSKRKNRERKDEIDDIYISTKGLARELNLPVWSVSQVNRTGAKENIIEGTAAAGSYDKIMISDLCLTLSRKKEDKVNGTGRIHVMKNRYGADGMTYNAKIDTSRGYIEIEDEYNPDDDEDTKPAVKKFDSDFDKFDKQLLKNKFFELNNK
jgi:replicative DNA helicase